MRLLLLSWCLILCAATPVLAAPSCAGAEFSVNLEIVVSEGGPEIPAMLFSVSRLAEKKDACWRSVARVDANLETDIDNFRRVLRAEGYYGASLDFRVARTSNAMMLTVVVQPGPRYQIATIETVFGETEDVDLKLAGPVSAVLVPGMPARSEDIVSAELAVVTTLGEQGYPFAEAHERQVIINHTTHSASVRYQISPGPFVRFGEVAFDGLVRTKSDYLQRFIPWQSGDPFAWQKLNDFRTRLMASSLFRSAALTVDRPSDPEGQIVLKGRVEEAPGHRLELGGGYSTGEGFDAEAAFTFRNAWGRGENLTLSAHMGETEQSVGARLRKPHFRRFGQTATLSARLGREDTPAYVSYLLETLAGIERKISRSVVGSVGIGAKATEVREDGERDKFLSLSLPIGVSFDTTDSLFDPSRGLRLNARVKPTGSLAGERFYFVSGELKAAIFKRFEGLDAVTFALRGRAGATWGADFDAVPLTERFFSGGGGSVRGFSYQGIGAMGEDGSPLGGRSVAEIAFEARTKISDTIGIVPFIDGGAVYPDATPRFDKFRWGAGVGLRYHTSIAPVRLDVAFPLARREGESALAIYVSIGQSF